MSILDDVIAGMAKPEEQKPEAVTAGSPPEKPAEAAGNKGLGFEYSAAWLEKHPEKK